MENKDLLKDLNFYLGSKDYTVSGEHYDLMYNKEYDLLITDPVPDNLDKYYESDAYISHTDNSETIIDKVYKTVRNYTLKRKLRLINSFKLNEKKILDIGAGTGDFLKICQDNNWDAFGIEPSKNARLISLKKGITLKENINGIRDHKFDVITMWHVLEHVTNLKEQIKLLKSILKEDGVLIIAVPNYKSYDAKYYKEFWAAYDVPRHIWHFSKNSIKKLFSEVQMNVEKILPMKFDSYYVSLLSEKYKNGRFQIFNAFWVGFLSNLKAKKNKEYSSHIYVIKNSLN